MVLLAFSLCNYTGITPDPRGRDRQCEALHRQRQPAGAPSLEGRQFLAMGQEFSHHCQIAQYLGKERLAESLPGLEPKQMREGDLSFRLTPHN